MSIYFIAFSKTDTEGKTLKKFFASLYYNANFSITVEKKLSIFIQF